MAPKKLPCGCTKDLSNLTFYHKEECKGVLLKGTLMDKGIIVCSKCHAINFYDRFIWTCPECGKRFRDKIKINNNVNKKIENEKINNKKLEDTNNICINEKNEKTTFYKNIVLNRKIHKSIDEIKVNVNNNTLNVNENITSDSPKRKKIKEQQKAKQH